MPTPRTRPTLTGEQPHAVRRRALRTIAVFEALKGAAVLAASLGLLSLLNRDLHQVALEVVERFGMNPDQHYPAIVLHYADVLADANRRALVLLAVCYVLVRFIEAYGLWQERAWGEWLGALSGALYVPFELHHLLESASVAGALVLAGNVLIVGYLALLVWQRRREKARAGPD